MQYVNDLKSVTGGQLHEVLARTRWTARRIASDVTYKLFPEQQSVCHELASPNCAALLRHLGGASKTARDVDCQDPERRKRDFVQVQRSIRAAV